MIDPIVIVERIVAKKAQMPNGCYSFSVGELRDIVAAVQRDAVASSKLTRQPSTDGDD